MFRKYGVLLLAALALGIPGVPAAAQNLAPSTWMLPGGDIRFTAYPIGLFGRNGNPDHWGGVGRLGYGVSDNFDVEGTAAIFDNFSLIGANTSFWARKDRLQLGFLVGAHQALIHSGHDSSAFDAAWQVGTRLTRRVRVDAGLALSVEKLDNVPRSTFSRFYFVPALDLRLTRELSFVSQLGLGMNSDSPSYLSAGFSLTRAVTDRDEDWH